MSSRVVINRAGAGEVTLRDAIERDEWIGWRGWRETGDPDLAATLEQTKRQADVAAGGGRPGALVPPTGALGRRWRALVGDALLVAAVVLTFPVAVLLFIGAGQAAVSVVAAALVLMLAGWVVGRGEE